MEEEDGGGGEIEAGEDWGERRRSRQTVFYRQMGRYTHTASTHI